MKNYAKFKVDDRWEENPFLAYKRDNEKTKTNYIQQNRIQIKRSECAERNSSRCRN